MDTKGRLIELAEGVYVESDVYNIVLKVKEYDPNLSVKVLARNADLTDAPYILVERCPDGIERKVFDIWELDDRVLDRLHNADRLKNDVLANIDKVNAARRRELKRRYEERILEANDIVKTALRSPKGSFSFKNEQGDLVTLDDDPTRRTVVEPRGN